MTERSPRSFRRPKLEDFAFEGDEVPLLLRRKVIAAVIIAFFALVLAYLVAAKVFGLSWSFDADPFKEWVDSFGAWGPVIFVAVMAFSVLFAPIPNVPIFIAAGLAWGPIIGTAYSLAGLLLGSTMAFYAARWLGRRHLPRLIGAKAACRLDDLSHNMGGQMIFWLRVLPAVNFDWISFAAGMTSMRFTPFILFSALGMLLPTALTVAAGNGLDSDIRLTFLMAGLWVIGIFASAVFFWYRRRRWQPTNPGSASNA